MFQTTNQKWMISGYPHDSGNLHLCISWHFLSHEPVLLLPKFYWHMNTDFALLSVWLALLTSHKSNQLFHSFWRWPSANLTSEQIPCSIGRSIGKWSMDTIPYCGWLKKILHQLCRSSRRSAFRVAWGLGLWDRWEEMRGCTQFMDGYGWLMMNDYGWLWMIINDYGWLWMIIIYIYIHI